jgi:aryl-alcohol dehydrogenase-like predicted oxidoreductase
VKQRPLGASGISVSVVGLGGNTFGPPRIDEAATVEVIHAALDLGINFVDTAIVYGQGESERYIATALKDRRDEMVLATKFHLMGLGDQKAADRIRAHADESLSKLKTDRIELYQIHMPNPDVPADEILGALGELVAAGKAREIGCSNYTSWRLVESCLEADRLGMQGFATVQNHYSLLNRQSEQELVSACRAYGVGLIPYHPLAGGFLTGKYRKGEPPPPGTRGAAGSPIVTKMSNDRNWEIVAALDEWAADHGHTVGELAIAWLVANDVVTSVIAGVSNVAQVEANAAGGAWELTEAEKAEVDMLATTGLEEPVEPPSR